MWLLLAVVGAAGSGGPALDIHPDASALPGTDLIEKLVSGFGYWALIAAIAGMLLSAVVWAVGHHSANYQQAYNGRKGVLVAAVAAIVIGAAPVLVEFFFNLGSSVK
jgi:hypothetical protein